jgi:hypothetical protein
MLVQNFFASKSLNFFFQDKFDILRFTEWVILKISPIK